MAVGDSARMYSGGSVEPVLEGLIKSQFADLYDDIDTSRGPKIKAIQDNPAWPIYFFVVSYICNWLCTIQSWGTGCECHAAEIAEKRFN